MKLPPIASPLTAVHSYFPDPDVVYPIEIAAVMAQVPRRRIAVYYRHGLVSPIVDPECGGWYFNDEAIRLLQQIEHLRIAYRMDLGAIGMMLGLMREIERLREEVRHLRG